MQIYLVNSVFVVILLCMFPLARSIDYGKTASIFSKARLSSSKITLSPYGDVDAKEDDGYMVQREYLKGSLFGTLLGWKIGATNEAAQSAMKFGPFYGPLFSAFKLNNASSVSLSSMGNLRAAEAEIAFCMKKSLPKRASGVAYTDEEVWDCIESVSGAIEIASTRYTEALTPAIVLGDLALNGCFVLGSPNLVKGMNLKDFVTVLATLGTEGKIIASDYGSNVLGNPVSALTWLVNKLNKDGHELQAGQVVITGAICASKEVVLPGILTAKFDGGVFLSNPHQVCLSLSS